MFDNPLLLIIVFLISCGFLFYFNPYRTKIEEKPLPTGEELRRLREKRLNSLKEEDESQKNNKVKSNQSKSESKETVSNTNEIEPSTLQQHGVKVKSPLDRVEPIEKPRRKEKFSITPRNWTPLKTGQELLEWEGIPQNLEAQIRNTRKRITRKPTAKMLMCVHDMAGNYSDDALVDGWYPLSSSNASLGWVWGFRPCHFASMDVFVYFSHNLVTIPPRGWIDASHKHGTIVLGTFLTEWQQGEQFCSEIFANNDTAMNAAIKLKLIAREYQFDGWLINIENKLELEMIPHMMNFLTQLSSDEDLFIVWYDSVISGTGELKWQNGLNVQNVEFFKRTNLGILTNYGWNEEKIQVSNLTADRLGGKLSSKNVWHGIDVFGRGTYGGGGFNCDAALNVLDHYSSPSACLFAPGWVLENAAERNASLGKTKLIEFWDKIYKNTAWGDNPVGTIEYDLTKNGFFTDFCDGGGSCLYFLGERIFSQPWLDLRRQMYQPRFDILNPAEADDAKAAKRMTIRLVNDIAPIYLGSSAIQVVGRRMGETSEDWCFFPLLSFESRLGGPKGPGSTLKITSSSFSFHGDIALSIDITNRIPTEANSRLVLVPKGSTIKNALPAISEYTLKGWKIRTWVLKTYELRGRKIVGVNVSPLPEKVSELSTWVDVRLGMISLDETNEPIICKITDLAVNQNLLTWKCSCGKQQGCAVQFVNVFVGNVFRTCAFSNECVVNELMSGDLIKLKAILWDGTVCEDVEVFV